MFGHKQRRGKQHPAADPMNWHLSQNIVWGGTEHQHAHCDQAKAGEFTYDDIFPFVCVHGFGINEFIMWLLPAHKKRDYGFPYKFPKNALLFFRGVRTWSFSQKPQRAGRAHGTPIGLRTNLSVNGNSQKLVSSYQTCERTHSHSQNFRKRMSMDNKPSPTPAIIQMGYFPISKCHQE